MKTSLGILLFSVSLFGAIGDRPGPTAPGPNGMHVVETPLSCCQPSGLGKLICESLGTRRPATGGVMAPHTSTSPSAGSQISNATCQPELLSLANTAKVGGIVAGPKKRVLRPTNPRDKIDLWVRGIGPKVLFYARCDPLINLTFRYNIIQSCWGTYQQTYLFCK